MHYNIIAAVKYNYLGCTIQNLCFIPKLWSVRIRKTDKCTTMKILYNNVESWKSSRNVSEGNLTLCNPKMSAIISNLN